MKYWRPSYTEMLKKSYAYDPVAQKSRAWRLMERLFVQNYLLQEPTNIVNIPKKIHQIWIGEKAFPDQYKRYAETWQKFHPDWEYKLWGNVEASTFPMEKREIFDQSTNYGMKSDIFRYEILKQIGGLYVDTDFECLKSFDDLMYLDFFTGIGYDSILQLYIGLIASVPNHPIIIETLNSIQPVYFGNKGSLIMNTTGANVFTKAFNMVTNGDTKGVVAFPPDFFYPFPNNVRKVDDPYKYVQECSYAIHHWAVSWSKSQLHKV